jgi:hypothetical protein
MDRNPAAEHTKQFLRAMAREESPTMILRIA